MFHDHTVCIIGAGIGGSTAALQLADAGFKVILIDKAKNAMSRTSGINPGRSAFGFHYTDANTGYQMIEGSKQFDRFFPDIRLDDGGARYFVVKDSQVSKEEYLKICELLKQKYDEQFGESENFYRVLNEKEYENEVDKNQVVLGIQTKEQLINMPKLVATVNHRLRAAKNITILTEHEVIDAKRQGQTFELIYKASDGKIGTLAANQVVNAAWEYRHKIDSFLGHKPDFVFTNRLKVLAKVQLPKSMIDSHSMMFVRGPFAMMANWRDGTAFLTYAPITNYSQTSDIEIPLHWESMITCCDLTEEKKALGHKIIEGAAKYIPQLAKAGLLDVRAGVIYSEGDANPSDPESAMHCRDKTGMCEIVPGWISLDTGKLILGPFYATLIRDLIKKNFLKNNVRFLKFEDFQIKAQD